MTPRKSTGGQKLRKVKAAAPINPKMYQFRLRMGTPNEMGETILVKTEGKLRTDIIKNLRTVHQPWCERYNKSGIAVIDRLVKELSDTTISLERSRIQGCIDEYWKIVVCYEFWKEWA